ncbi:MAG: hypothetical protein WAO07_13595, partial [Desulfobacterales bacterium]
WGPDEKSSRLSFSQKKALERNCQRTATNVVGLTHCHKNKILNVCNNATVLLIENVKLERLYEQNKAHLQYVKTKPRGFGN